MQHQPLPCDVKVLLVMLHRTSTSDGHPRKCTEEKSVASERKCLSPRQQSFCRGLLHLPSLHLAGQKERLTARFSRSCRASLLLCRVSWIDWNAHVSVAADHNFAPVESVKISKPGSGLTRVFPLRFSVSTCFAPHHLPGRASCTASQTLHRLKPLLPSETHILVQRTE